VRWGVECPGEGVTDAAWGAAGDQDGWLWHWIDGSL
jgi:hypothetical protein